MHLRAFYPLRDCLIALYTEYGGLGTSNQLPNPSGIWTLHAAPSRSSECLANPKSRHLHFGGYAWPITKNPTSVLYDGSHQSQDQGGHAETSYLYSVSKQHGAVVTEIYAKMLNTK
ncbi:hypothetical protein ACMFMF_004325 [Clarireedia jacksonii]